MWFSVVWFDKDSGKLIRAKVNHTQLFHKFDFENHINSVIAFTREAGIGSDIMVGNCFIVRIR